jgi:DNA-binding response OmpR family regulator
MDDNDKLGPVARRLAATQRVLCVEDEPDIASFLRAYFRAAGFDLVHIDPDDVQEVVDAAVEHEPDAILLDLRLRGFSGSDAYRRLRADERFAFVPVIMVSAHAEADPQFEAPAGLDAFVAKPFNTNLLADLVRERLEVAARLAKAGRHDELELMTQEYLDARLVDEIAISSNGGTFSFGLLRLLSMEAVLAEVGPSGRNHLVTTLVRTARRTLPEGTVIGLTTADELAMVFPTLDISSAFAALRPVLDGLAGTFEFPGGAVVPVEVACGLAAYPDNAGDTDELFMAADAALTEAVDAGTRLHRAL